MHFTSKTLRENKKSLKTLVKPVIWIKIVFGRLMTFSLRELSFPTGNKILVPWWVKNAWVIDSTHSTVLYSVWSPLKWLQFLDLWSNPTHHVLETKKYDIAQTLSAHQLYNMIVNKNVTILLNKFGFIFIQFRNVLDTSFNDEKLFEPF